jgi:uncharacterized Zn finger protein
MAFDSGSLRALADERGEAYAAGHRVKRLELSDADTAAAVRGTRTYRVRLWLSG